MDHHIIVIDTGTLKAKAVKVSREQLQHMDDCEDFIIIDPLTNQVFVDGDWVAIPTAQVKEFSGIVTLEP